MQVQSSAQLTAKQDLPTTIKVSKTNEEFKIQHNNTEDKYKKYEHYIKNLAKIDAKMYNITIEEATANIKGIIDNKDDPNAPSLGWFPLGANLTDEFTDAIVKASETLSSADFQMLMIKISIKNQPTLDDERYYTHSGKFGTQGYNIVPKNDPKYPMYEYGKENFESNKTILNMLNEMLQDLIEGAKKFGDDIDVAKNAYEILIENINKGIKKSEDEKNAKLENITKNNRPNPLSNING